MAQVSTTVACDKFISFLCCHVLERRPVCTVPSNTACIILSANMLLHSVLDNGTQTMTTMLTFVYNQNMHKSIPL